MTVGTAQIRRLGGPHSGVVEAAVTVALVCAVTFAPSQAFAADVNDGSTTGISNGISPDTHAVGISPDAQPDGISPDAASSSEDAGPLPDYSNLTDGTYRWTGGSDHVSILAAQVWAACGIFDDKQKLVRAFSRVAASTTKGDPGYLPAGTSNLKCGSDTWGYNHIVKNHLSQWENDAAIEGKNWRDLADFAISVALTDPDTVTYRKSNDTYCFSREIYLIDKRNGQVVATRYPNVTVAAASKQIITAFPASAQCR
jgi:hypothetical protein